MVCYVGLCMILITLTKPGIDITLRVFMRDGLLQLNWDKKTGRNVKTFIGRTSSMGFRR